MNDHSANEENRNPDRARATIAQWRPAQDEDESTDNEEEDIVEQTDNRKQDTEQDVEETKSTSNAEIETRAQEIRDVWDADMAGWARMIYAADSPSKAALYSAYWHRSMALRDQEIAKLTDPSIEVKYPMKGIELA